MHHSASWVPCKHVRCMYQCAKLFEEMICIYLLYILFCASVDERVVGGGEGGASFSCTLSLLKMYQEFLW